MQHSSITVCMMRVTATCGGVLQEVGELSENFMVPREWSLFAVMFLSQSILYACTCKVTSPCDVTTNLTLCHFWLFHLTHCQQTVQPWSCWWHGELDFICVSFRGNGVLVCPFCQICLATLLYNVCKLRDWCILFATPKFNISLILNFLCEPEPQFWSLFNQLYNN